MSWAEFYPQSFDETKSQPFDRLAFGKSFIGQAASLTIPKSKFGGLKTRPTILG
jgi:hypothetical protein